MQAADLTGLRDLTGWPKGMRLIVRRVKLSRRDLKTLTVFEQRTGWRYQIAATNFPDHQGLSVLPGAGQAWFVDALYRDHAEVEDRVKAIKRVGIGLLPSKSWQLNVAWVLAAALAADVDAWTRLLLLRDELELAAAETENDPQEALPPASPPHHPRPQARTPPGPVLALSQGLHHGLPAPHRPPGHHLTAGPDPDEDQGGGHPAPPPGPWKPAQPAATRDGPDLTP